MDAAMDSRDSEGASNTIIPVVIKHQGKKYDVDLDVSEPGDIFKSQVFSLTGVLPNNQKIVIKGRIVKDETDMSVLGLKPGQTIMVLGKVGEGPVQLTGPAQTPRFVEDMSGVDLDGSKVLMRPGGLKNLGNTCYLNATLQALRSIPELQNVLVNQLSLTLRDQVAMSAEDDSIQPSELALARDLREVFFCLSRSSMTYTPDQALNTLRILNPRFAERVRGGMAYAQQDAEEVWTFLLEYLRQHVFTTEKLPTRPVTGFDSGASTVGTVTEGENSYNVVKRYMAGETEKKLVCDNPEGRTDGDTSVERETFYLLPCHITITTNHLRDGLLAGLTTKITKFSEKLNQDSTFTSTAKIVCLPKYLSVHFMRFYWKRDIQKKAKIMRKVTFPHELDMTEMCTDELRTTLLPVREKVREVRKEIDELERSGKKRKRRLSSQGVETTADTGSGSGSGSGNNGEDATYETEAQIEEKQRASVEKAKEELYELVRPQLEKNPHANHSGLYELRAVVAHQGPGAESGHYTAFVKKGSLVDPMTDRTEEADGNWWWFNDATVTEVPKDRIDALAGGGESHSALVLLYGSVPLPLPASHKVDFFQS